MSPATLIAAKWESATDAGQLIVRDEPRWKGQGSTMQRIVILVYGILVYILFLGVFAYAFGFVADAFVPKGINTGEPGAFWPSLLINSGLLALFAIQHAVMARPAFKRWITQYLPKPAERSTFVLATCIVFILLFIYWQPMTGIIWQIEHIVGRAIMYTIFVAGMLTVLYSSFLIDHFDLFGLRQVVLHAKKVDYWQRPFIERSLYKLVRHPLMVGFLLAFWATPTMTVGHLLFAIMTTGYIFIGIQMEERDLIRQHGEEYLAYKRRTPGLLPRFTRKPAVAPAPGITDTPPAT